MHWWVVGRTVVMYLFILVMTRLMGKREIGSLSPFDLVVAIMIAELGSIPLETRSIPLLHGLLPIAVLTGLEILFSYISLKHEGIRRLITGEPTVLVENGRILHDNLKKIRYNLSDLLHQLRDKNIFNVADVEFAILETSGRLSVLPRSQKRPVTPEDLGISTKYEGLVHPLIADGIVQYQHLSALGLDVYWLKNELKKHGVDRFDDVLLATLDAQGNLYVSKKREQPGPSQTN